MPKTILTQEDLDAYSEAEARKNAARACIIDRIDQIWTTIFKAFGLKRPRDFCWWFDDAQEGEVGTLDIDCEYIDNFQCINLNRLDNANAGNEFFWLWRWPKEFLLMTDKEIIDYIQDTIVKTELKKEKDRESREARAAKKEAAVEKALSKLSDADKKALGITRRKKSRKKA